MSSFEAKTEQSSTYILSMDLGEKLEAFRRIGIDAPGPHDQFTRDLQSEIVDSIQTALPEVHVEGIYMADLADEVIGSSVKMTSVLDDPLVVSSCPEIAYPAGGEELQINRLINIKGDQIGLGPRPGYPSLDKQITAIRQKADTRDIVIVEDGIFTGGTVRYIIQKFNEAHVRVKGVITGFNCAEHDTSWFDSNGYDLITTKSYPKIHDWVPDHDFIPFIPGNGKVLGTDIGSDNFYPFYDHRRATYSVPYIRPFGLTEKWAGIPAESTGAVSTKCLNVALALFKEIEKRNSSHDIRIGDLMATRQRCSVPMILNSENFPPLSSQVTRYLKECL
jgi:hypothetical protein